ncbi:hypothetical protein [Allomesorhizobium camelthorni]|uniref:Uncharacterized protein n=1 Tax=Allomesorhizobium camelthorni TaxID=475069 RepID=A0A6G4WCK2_9HYPH|nr:hypothetical protein [Mesorhizobium camelthorni]NGO52329.1 hypothetical protein [Mesorhizobium camelthorni]
MRRLSFSISLHGCVNKPLKSLHILCSPSRGEHSLGIAVDQLRTDGPADDHIPAGAVRDQFVLIDVPVKIDPKKEHIVPGSVIAPIATYAGRGRPQAFDSASQNEIPSDAAKAEPLQQLCNRLSNKEREKFNVFSSIVVKSKDALSAISEGKRPRVKLATPKFESKDGLPLEGISVADVGNHLPTSVAALLGPSWAQRPPRHTNAARRPSSYDFSAWDLF